MTRLFNTSMITTLNWSVCLVSALVLGHPHSTIPTNLRPFSSTPFLLENIPNSIIPFNSPLPEAYRFYIELASIHSAA